MARVPHTPGSVNQEALLKGSGHAPLVVWSVWFLALLGDLIYVITYGHNVPVYDDYNIVPVMTGDLSMIPSWLWEQVNEHRIPLGKLILIALVRLSGGDLRSGMVFNVLAMGVLAFAMIWAAKRTRGWTSYTDAFFPLMLLHLGHGENFLWGWQVVQMVPILLAGTLLVLLLLRASQLTYKLAVFIGFWLVLLALTGPPGIVYVPFFGLELIRADLLVWGTWPKRRCLFILLLAAAAFVAVALYLIGYQPTRLPPSPGLRASLRTSAQFLSMSFAFKAKALWPYSALVMLWLALSSTAMLAIAWYRNPPVRSRAVSLLVFLMCTVVLAVSVGPSRAGFGYSAGFAMRYVSFLTPFLCCVYFIWEMYTPLSPVWTRLGRRTLLVLASLIFLLNTPSGLRYARTKAEKLEALERDVRNGVPIYLLVHRYTPFVQYSQDWMAESLQMLQRVGVEPFTHLREDPPFSEIPLDVEPSATHRMTWTQRTGQGLGDDSCLVYSLPRPTFVAGIRITYSLTNREGIPANFRLCWKSSDQDNFTDGQCYETMFMETGPEEYSTAISVCDTVSQIQIFPESRPFTFRVSSIVLLVPEGNKL
jgi:hypothetical protein